MYRETLIHELSTTNNLTRIHRQKICQLILKNKYLLSHLVNLSFEFDNKLSIKAASILEVIVKDSENHILPYFNQITRNLSKLKFHSTRRYFAKICEIIVENHQKNGFFDEKSYKKSKKEIISICFDWLITNQKVAVEVYAMSVLYVLGQEEKWIHHEIKHILSINIENKSFAYKARGKKILKLISSQV